MRDKKGLYTYGINPDFLKLLAKHQKDNQQIRFILEAAGYGNVEDYIEDEKQEVEEQGKVKKYFKDIFKKVG